MEDIYTGYKGEDGYRKNLIDNITKAKYEDLKEVCSKLEYGFSNYDIIRMAEAFKQENKELNDKIEYILTDCNFHRECSLLNQGKADYVIQTAKEEIEDYLESHLSKIFRDEYRKNSADSCIPAKATVLKDYSISELYFLVNRGIIQKSNCEELTFELTKKEKELIEKESYKDNIKKQEAFKLYDNLTKEQKIYLVDLQIIDTIKSYNWDKSANVICNQEQEQRLFDVIQNAWIKDKKKGSLSYISNVIVEAWARDLVDLQTLESASTDDILNCIYGFYSFAQLRENEEIFDKEYSYDQCLPSETQKTIQIGIEKAIKGDCKYDEIINTALESTQTGNYIINLKNQYGLNELEIQNFSDLLNKDKRVANVEWSKDGNEADIIFYLENCPNAKDDEEGYEER